MSRYVSVRWKIVPPVALIVLIIVALATGYSAYQQKHRLLITVETQMYDMLNSYLDSLNAMMFTGTMANREMLREKIMSREGVVNLKVLRGEQVKKLFGDGFETEQPENEFDQRILNGEQIINIEHIDGERVLTVMMPFIAERDHNGTNCLMCHGGDDVEGMVLGGARLSFSLAKKDAEIEKELWFSAGMNLLILLAGLALINWIVNHVILKPLNGLQRTMEVVRSDADLSQRVKLGSHDEFYKVGDAVNQMLDRFQPAISELTQTMHDMLAASQKLSEVTEETRRCVTDQEQQSKHLSVAMEELTVAANEVARSATGADDNAGQARKVATSGHQVVKDVTGIITKLAQQVEASSNAMSDLVKGSQNISQVSDTITAIAEQTNLLALNAAIEAARAGEQGRGFAVVADEVRTLAQSTQDATKQIKDTIEQLVASSTTADKVIMQSRDYADQSVQKSSQAAGALEQIVQDVDVISSMNAQIATAAEEQTSVASEINNSIQAINVITQTTAEGAKRTSLTSEEVAKMAAKLDQIVSQFKV